MQLFRLCTLLALVFLGIGPSSNARILPPPMPIEDLFQRVDRVCVIRAEDVTQVDTAGHSGFVVSGFVLSDFKGAFNNSQIEVYVPRTDLLDLSPITSGHTYLLFIEKDLAGHFSLSNLPGSIAVLPSWASPSAQVKGPLDLQTLITKRLQTAQSEADTRSWLELLRNFRSLSPSATATVEELFNDKSQVVRIEALLLLVHQGANAQHLTAKLITEVATFVNEDDLPHIDYLADAIASDTNTDDLMALEGLAHSSNSVLALNAMIAIRKMQATSSINFLTSMLDSSNANLQYQAIMSLAEMTHTYGDYAPSIVLFRADPTKYLRLWKEKTSH